MQEVKGFFSSFSWEGIAAGFAGGLILVFWKLRREPKFKTKDIPGILITGMILANYGGVWAAKKWGLALKEACLAIGVTSPWLVDWLINQFPKKADKGEKDGNSDTTN